MEKKVMVAMLLMLVTFTTEARQKPTGRFRVFPSDSMAVGNPCRVIRKTNQ